MINRAILTGRLTRNVDLRYTPSGIAVGNFRLAVDRNFLDRNGQRGADFINCVIWRKSAENFANFTHKGSLVGIDGRLQSRSYTNKQGQRVYVTEIVVDNFALLESRAQSQAQGQPNGPANPAGNQTPQPNRPGNSNPQGGFNPFANPNNGNGPQSNPNSQPSPNRPKPTNRPGSNSNRPSQPAGKAQNNNGPKKPNGNGKPDHTKDPFANSGNKKIDISDDDLPF